MKKEIETKDDKYKLGRLLSSQLVSVEKKEILKRLHNLGMSLCDFKHSLPLNNRKEYNEITTQFIILEKLILDDIE